MGRTAELAALDDALRQSRCAVLTGPPGVGKSALAAEYRRRSDRFVQSCRVDLRGAAAPGQLLARVAAGLGLSISTSSVSTHVDTPADHPTATDLLVAAIDFGANLMVLDDADTLSESLARLAGKLLAARPDLRLLVTQRSEARALSEVLGAIDVLEVGPLAAARGGPADDGASELASDLLGPAAPEGVVADIVGCSGGNPLAIEILAGSWRRDPEVLERIPANHREPLDAIVTAVAGGLSTTASEVLAICGVLPLGATERLLADLVGGADTLAPALDELRSRALLRPGSRRGEPVHCAAWAVTEALHRDLPPEWRSTLLDRITEHVAEEAATVSLLRVDAPANDTVLRLVRDADTQDAVLRHLATTSPRRGLHLALALTRVFRRRTSTEEGRAWLTGAAERLTLEPADSARVTVAVTHLATGLADVAEQLAVLESAVAVLAESEPPTSGWHLAGVTQLAIARGWAGDIHGASTAISESEALAAATGSEWAMAVVARYRALWHALIGEPAKGVPAALAAADRLEAVGDPAEAAGALYFASVLSRMAGLEDRSFLHRARDLADAADAAEFRALIAVEIAQDSLQRGRPDAAIQLAHAASLVEATGNMRTAATTRRDLGLLLLSLGRTNEARREFVRSAEVLLRLDPMGASLAIGALAHLSDPGPERRQLVESAWQLTRTNGTPLSASQLATLRRLTGTPADPIPGWSMAHTSQQLSVLRASVR